MTFAWSEIVRQYHRKVAFKDSSAATDLDIEIREFLVIGGGS